MGENNEKEEKYTIKARNLNEQTEQNGAIFLVFFFILWICYATKPQNLVSHKWLRHPESE